jgi:kynurenine formamidase
MCLPGTVEAVRARSEEGATRITRRDALRAGAGLTAATTLVLGGAPAAARRVRHRQDLTHVLAEGFPVFAFDPPVRRTLVTIQDNGFYSQEWTLQEHSGTHLDAPGHFIIGGRFAPAITPEELSIPVAVIDISRRAARNPDATVRVHDLERYEDRHGRIPRGAGVFMYSGWERRLPDPDAFKNPGPDGLYHFPGWSIDAATWLLERRHIRSLGVDTLSLDPGNSTTFDVHVALLGADRYGLENVANLKRLPPRGAHAFVGLVPWEEGSGGPCRIIAHW